MGDFSSVVIISFLTVLLDLTCEGLLFLSEKKSTSPITFRSPSSALEVLRLRLTGNPKMGNILSLVLNEDADGCLEGRKGRDGIGEDGEVSRASPHPLSIYKELIREREM